MGRISTWYQKHKRAAIGGAGAGIGALIILGTVLSQVGGGDEEIPGVVRTLQVKPTRDIGALPSRDSWCSAARSAEHCWLLQESSGNAVDSGATGGWDLTTADSPRRGIATGLPTSGPSVVYDEKAVWLDGGAARLYRTSTAIDATDVLSITAVWRSDVPATTKNLIYAVASNKGVRVYYNNAGIYWRAYDGVSSDYAMASLTDFGGWHCDTFIFDTTSANGAAWFRDGVTMSLTDDDQSAAGQFNETVTYIIGNFTDSVDGALARYRWDVSKLSIDSHRLICGPLFAGNGLASGNRAAQSIYWQQAGKPRCFMGSLTTAECFPAGPAVTYDAAQARRTLAVDAIQRTNRLLYNTRGFDCTNWTCSTATIATSEAPDHSLTAANITMGGGYVQQAATGYSNSTALNLAVWVKCSTGTLAITHQGDTGSWSVTCATVAGSWAYILPGHPALAVNTAFQSSSSGGLTLRFASADAHVWAPTATQEASDGVIPTGSAPATVGVGLVKIDNSDGRYYRVGSQVIQTVTQLSGTCWSIVGTDLLLSGAVGSECIGHWGLLEVRR